MGSQGRGREKPSSQTSDAYADQKQMDDQEDELSIMMWEEITVLNCWHEQILYFEVLSQTGSVKSTLEPTELISVDHSLLAEPAFTQEGPGTWFYVNGLDCAMPIYLNTALKILEKTECLVPLWRCRFPGESWGYGIQPCLGWQCYSTKLLFCASPLIVLICRCTENFQPIFADTYFYKSDISHQE